MKISTRILTSLIPLTTIGVVTPIVVSCSCGTESITINYGDNVNCKDKNDNENKFHSLDVVKNAIKDKVNVEFRQVVDINEINEKISANDTAVVQNIYYDFVASETILYENEINLKSWTTTHESSKINITFNLNGQDKTLTNVQYRYQDNKIQFGANDYWLNSYTYKDCTANL